MRNGSAHGFLRIGGQSNNRTNSKTPPGRGTAPRPSVLTPEPLEGRVLMSAASHLGRAQYTSDATVTDSTVTAAPTTTQSLSTQSLSTQSTTVAALPVMPTSDNYYGAIVNANNYVTNYMYPEYISPDVRLITDLKGTSAATYADGIAALQAQRPGALVGTYHSSRDAQLASTMTDYPRRAVPREGINSSQVLMPEPGVAGADIANYTQTSTKNYLVKNVVQDVVNTGSRLAFLDNVSHNESGFPIAWATTMSMVKTMVTNLHAQSKRVIVNAAWVPGATSNTSVDQMIATGVDGVSLEMALEKNVRTDVTKINTAMAQYRKMLDAGMTVVFIPLGSATGGADTIEKIENESRLQAGFGMMFRKPGDRLFTNELFFRTVPEWTAWPKTFGPALGAATVTKDALGQIIMTRQFANDTLTINVNTKEVTYTAPGTATTTAAATTTSTQSDPVPVSTFSTTPITSTSSDLQPITRQVPAYRPRMGLPCARPARPARPSPARRLRGVSQPPQLAPPERKCEVYPG